MLVADGRLAWQTISAIDGQIVIDHPVLLKRVELRFDPNVSECTVHETDREPELYGGLFVDLQQVAPVAIRNHKNELETAGYHPLGWEDTEAFLKAFIQTVSPLNGEFLDPPNGDGASNIPRLWRDPVLILRKRVAGIANAVDAIINDIECREQFPPALAQITGTVDQWENFGFAARDNCKGTAGQSTIPPAINDE